MKQTYSLRDIAKIIGVSPMTLSKAKSKGEFSSKVQNLLALHGLDADEILKSVNQSVNFRGQAIKINADLVNTKAKSESNLMVGANGLEPLTSVLSGLRSSQLS